MEPLCITFLDLLGGISNSGVDAKWPLLDNYQAPYREPLIANPTINTITKTNGIISIVPPPPNYNRHPRNIFSPSLKITTPKPVINANPLGFVPVTPSWLYSTTPRTTQKPTYRNTRYHLANNGPILSQLQRPISYRRPKMTTVKHGIIPILKSRYRPPDIFRKIINYY